MSIFDFLYKFLFLVFTFVYSCMQFSFVVCYKSIILYSTRMQRYLSVISKISVQEVRLIVHLLSDYRVRAFLNLISYCEGTIANSSIFLKEFEYYKPMITEYTKSFASNDPISLWEHPGKAKEIETSSHVLLRSTAAGRYQFLKGTWDRTIALNDLQKNYPLIADDLAWFYKNISLIYDSTVIRIYKNGYKSLLNIGFGPFMQDYCAVVNLFAIGAIKHILLEDWENAIELAAHIWATLPIKKTTKESNFTDHVAMIDRPGAVKILRMACDASRQLKSEVRNK